MRIDDLISRATATTGRSLLAVSSVIVASGVVGFKIEQLPLFAQGKIPEEQLRMIAVPLIIFLLAAHLLNWWNDRNGYLHSTEREKSTALQQAIAGMEPRLSMLIAGNPSPYPNEPPDMTKHMAANLGKRAGDLSKSYNRLWVRTNWSERIALFGQHFLVPVGFGAWAIYLLRDVFI